MKSRILVAVIGVPVLLFVVLAAPEVMVPVLCILAGIGSYELQKCVSRKEADGVYGGVMSLSILCAVLTVNWNSKLQDGLSMFIMVETVIFFGLAVIEGGAVKFEQIMAGLFGSVAIGWSFSAFLRLNASGLPRIYLLLPFILSFACDTFAFFAGLTLGKHKLAPKVSPKKTIEGSIGGLAGNIVCGLLFVWVMDRWFGGSVIAYGQMVWMALFCGVVAQIGDLSFSLIKREYGIKDYGKLFLAHGGVLDRFDSVLFVAPVVEIIFSLL